MAFGRFQTSQFSLQYSSPELATKSHERFRCGDKTSADCACEAEEDISTRGSSFSRLPKHLAVFGVHFNTIVSMSMAFVSRLRVRRQLTTTNCRSRKTRSYSNLTQQVMRQAGACVTNLYDMWSVAKNQRLF